MSTRVSENPEVAQHYATQVALTSALLAALRRLWPVVNPMQGAQAVSRYKDGVAAVVDQFAMASNSLSADYYDAMRARAGVPGTFNVQLIDTPPHSLVNAGVEWAMKAQVEMAATAEKIQQRVDAAMQKAVADSGRNQVVAAVEGDQLALGFARVARSGACSFCIVQAIRRTRDGRLGVYKSRASAGQIPASAKGDTNRFHNNCHCVVVPIFAPDHKTLEPHLAPLEALYVESTANSKRGESLNDFRKALEAMRAGKSTPTSTPQGAPSAPSQADQLAALLGKLAGH